MNITEHEMRGLLTGKCIPGDMLVNEQLPAYLVRKFAELKAQRSALAAENASMMTLAIACEKEFGAYTVEEFPDDAKVSYPEERCNITFGMIRQALNKTATDAYLNSVRADGVDKAIAHLHKKFEGTGQIGVPVMALESLAAQLRAGKDGV